MTGAYNGFAELADVTSETARMQFIVRSMLSEVITATLVIVKTVHATGQSFAVDVQPMVHQVDSAGNAVPHGTIYKMPVWRLQGGAAAVIVKPAVGDIGLAVFGHNDLSNVKRAKTPTTPGSFRKFAWSDGIYLGGVLNADPTQSIVMDGANMTINAVGTLTINATGVTINAPVTATGEGTFNNHTVGGHTHGGVTTGTGTTGTPTG
jgi:hypothetical protein